MGILAKNYGIVGGLDFWYLKGITVNVMQWQGWLLVFIDNAHRVKDESVLCWF